PRWPPVHFSVINLSVIFRRVMAIRLISKLIVPFLCLVIFAGPLVEADEPSGNDFDPAAWLRARKLGRLMVKTPQSDRPLRGIAAATREDWETERGLYLKVLRELIGPWPAERPALSPRVLEEREFPKYVRFKVGFQSLPSGAEYASEIRAWLFLPRAA